MRRIAHYITFLGLAVLSSASSAQDTYLSIYSGGVFLGDYNGEQEELPPPPPPPPPTILGRNGTFSDGWFLGAALGKRCCENVRIEGEFSYRSATGDTWNVTRSPGPNTSTPWSGRINCYSSMVNGILEKPVTENIVPYVGAGLGVAVLDGELGTLTSQFDFDETEFAFQGIAGFRTQLTESLGLLTEYRYYGTTEGTLRDRPTQASIDNFSFSSHNVLIGFQLSR